LAIRQQPLVTFGMAVRATGQEFDPRAAAQRAKASSAGATADLFDLAGDTPLSADCLSSALMTVFRGNFCDVILPGRNSITFERNETLYELGDEERTLFFVRSGFVKVGTITDGAREILYDIRKEGDVAGELCFCRALRADRAVALETSDVIAVPHFEVFEALQKHPALFGKLVEIFCDCLADAYEQINTMALRDSARRLTRVLIGLAAKIGRRSGSRIEIPTYLTQEDISQMVVARRERVSTALNFLRRRGMVEYSSRGHLLLDIEALESQDF
jgi:CRP/FNR family transcriptional regulator, cyclic AMP receptor protein